MNPYMFIAAQQQAAAQQAAAQQAAAQRQAPPPLNLPQIPMPIVYDQLGRGYHLDTKQRYYPNQVGPNVTVGMQGPWYSNPYYPQ